MSDCTNIICDREATTEIKFAGIRGTYPYCDEHAEELKEIEEIERGHHER